MCLDALPLRPPAGPRREPLLTFRRRPHRRRRSAQPQQPYRALRRRPGRRHGRQRHGGRRRTGGGGGALRAAERACGSRPRAQQQHGRSGGGGGTCQRRRGGGARGAWSDGGRGGGGGGGRGVAGIECTGEPGEAARDRATDTGAQRNACYIEPLRLLHMLPGPNQQHPLILSCTDVPRTCAGPLRDQPGACGRGRGPQPCRQSLLLPEHYTHAPGRLTAARSGAPHRHLRRR